MQVSTGILQKMKNRIAICSSYSTPGYQPEEIQVSMHHLPIQGHCRANTQAVESA